MPRRHEEFDAAILQPPEREVKKFGMGSRFCDEWLDRGMKGLPLGRNAGGYSLIPVIFSRNMAIFFRATGISSPKSLIMILSP